MERITEQSNWPVKWVGRDVVELNILDFVFCKPGFLELPVEVIPAVFQDVTQRNFLVRVSKIVKHPLAKRRVDDVAESAEIRSSTEDDTARSQNLFDALEDQPGIGKCSITSERKMKSNLPVNGESDLHRFQLNVSIPWLAM
jgi:hypothetical protein